jgi:co-chaperonin GroES (HSP10)
MALKAANNTVWLIRDAVQKEKDGLILANTGRVKPHTGTIVTVGSLVRDQEIKRAKNQKAMFHPQVGFEIEHEGQIYLVCQGEEIIGLP